MICFVFIVLCSFNGKIPICWVWIKSNSLLVFFMGHDIQWIIMSWFQIFEEQMLKGQCDATFSGLELRLTSECLAGCEVEISQWYEIAALTSLSSTEQNPDCIAALGEQLRLCLVIFYLWLTWKWESTPPLLNCAPLCSADERPVVV